MRYSVCFFFFFFYQDGVISVKDIDLVMSEGLGMRYAFIGPMETMHLNAPEGNVQSPPHVPEQSWTITKSKV